MCIVHTVHKVNDWLHPMQCIPETQFFMRSKIHLAVLLHLWCKWEREETTPNLNKFYSRLALWKTPNRIPAEAQNKYILRILQVLNGYVYM